ncbi:glycosyltransferase [Halocalculus aciditolerans]|uniref:Glycosyl transferase family 1 n=1 Tax=Halocalculus aciditolerans TaxID=1383812 RepID=A0A830FES6_9EURY|nr:glycosyltransferase [Halocalculus aciditolerans]GGL68223.1 glycosyl transferase family 1 [Halocalculus aciditolerans]
MKIVHAGKYYYPDKGGIEQVIQTLAEGAADRGHDANVVAAASGWRGGSFKHNGVDVTKSGEMAQMMGVPAAPTYPLKLRRAAQSADVVHHHLPNPLDVGSSFILNHDGVDIVTYHSDIVRQSEFLRAYRPILRKFLKSVDGIITTSPQLRENSSILKEFQEKTTVIPLGIDLEQYRPDEIQSYDIDKPVVLFVGRLNYYKGVEYLVRAAAQINARVVIVGDGDRRESLEELTTELGVDDCVSFEGKVSEQSLKRWYKTADVFALPSIEPSEAFGVVQLEAMAFETPVVNTDLPTGVPWVSKDGETGFTIHSSSSEQLSEALRKLLLDEGLRNHLGTKARQRVEEKFEKNHMVNKTIKFYEQNNE